MAGPGIGMSRRKGAPWALAAALALTLLPASAAQGANSHASSRAVCPAAPAAHGRCHALVVTDRRGNPRAGSAPQGLSPQTIRSAYGFPAEGGAGETVAIVDAYDDPTAETDLNAFSAEFGLPSCTTANGCFAKVDQRGGAIYPRKDQGWALEISLDVQWAHAIAPGAKILLVEAESNSFANLLAAEDYAKAHADYVSNSWGGSEFGGEAAYDSHFKRAGVSFFVSAGDAGLPAEYPSASPGVISVGGTTLHFDKEGNLTGETGWSKGGGGCSAYESANPAQSGFSGYGQVKCGGRRATPDVALDADPSSGVAVYDSTKYYGQTGWFAVGGTSASTPMWAGRSAVEGAVVDAAYVYGSSIGFRDIVSGNNGAACLTGFDLCSGRGSWFSGSSPPPQEPLAFEPGAQALTAGQASGEMRVSLPSAPAGDVTISLSSSSSAGRFAPSAGGPWGQALEVAIAAGKTTSAPFYYEDTAAGSPTLTASASGYAGAGQTETVTAAALASIAVSPGAATVVEGGTQGFGAAGADAYGNPVDVSEASWSTTAPGSLSPASGTTTVFSAGLEAGGGLVTAAIGPIEGSASVTVVELTLAAPTGLTASPQGKHISLSWQASGPGVTYNLYRGTSPGGEGSAPYASGLVETSAKDLNVAAGTTYYYYATAVGPGGAESPASNEDSARAR
jgi:hypothetical protein